jgi:hypothetical protein
VVAFPFPKMTERDKRIIDESRSLIVEHLVVELKTMTEFLTERHRIDNSQEALATTTGLVAGLLDAASSLTASLMAFAAHPDSGEKVIGAADQMIQRATKAYVQTLKECIESVRTD